MIRGQGRVSKANVTHAHTITFAALEHSHPRIYTYIDKAGGNRCSEILQQALAI